MTFADRLLFASARAFRTHIRAGIHALGHRLVPGHALVEEANLDPDHVRKLAEAFLSKHKVKPGPVGAVSPP
jgi:hypothetical protein